MQLIANIPKDKLLHFITGVLIYVSTYWLLSYYSLVLVIVIAVGKEVYDYFHKDIHTPELLDAVATILGGLVIMIGEILNEL